MPNADAATGRIVTRRLGICIALTILVAFGGWLRLRNLGRLSLIGDEGIQALAVQGILEKGVPRVDSGRLYKRALPYLHMQAFAAQKFGLNEFSLRLPSAIFGIAAILFAYLLGNTLFGWRVGLMLAGLLTVSAWEVEISRYARSYTAFQCAYLCGLLLFYQGFIRGRLAAKIGFVAVAFIALTLHQAGIMLGTCFLIPLILNRVDTRRVLWYLGGLAGVIVLWGISMLYTMANGRSPVMQIMRKFAARLEFPQTRAWDLVTTNTPFIALTILAVWLSWFSLRRTAGRGLIGWHLLRVGMLWAAWAHQFGVVLVLLVVFMVVYRKPRAFGSATVGESLSLGKDSASWQDWIFIAIVVFGLFWGSWAMRLDGVGFEGLGKFLFGYPNLRQYFLGSFLSGWPMTAGFLAAGTVWFARRFRRDPADDAPLFVLCALWIPLVVTSTVYAPFYNPRYWFHLYPLIVMMIAALLIHLGGYLLRRMGGLLGTALFGVMAVAVLGFSDDFRAATAWAVGSRTYQSVRDPIRSPVNSKIFASFHQDHQQVGRFVREHRQPGDRVIVLGPMHHASMYNYYAGKVDYSLLEAPKYQPKLPSRQEGTSRDKRKRPVNPVTGSENLEDVGRIRSFLEGKDRHAVWLIGDNQFFAPRSHGTPDPNKAYLAPLAAHPDILGRDGRSFAVRVEPKEIPKPLVLDEQNKPAASNATREKELEAAVAWIEMEKKAEATVGEEAEE